MSILLVYFTAPDDSAAAEVIDWLGGPDVGSQDGSVDPYPSALTEFDESAQLTWIATMEADPTGTVPEAELGKTLALKGQGEIVVHRLSQAARDALALLDSDPEASEAAWALSELGDLDEVVEDAPALIRLAVEAQRQGRSLYCWLSI